MSSEISTKSEKRFDMQTWSLILYRMTLQWKVTALYSTEGGLLNNMERSLFYGKLGFTKAEYGEGRYASKKRVKISEAY